MKQSTWRAIVPIGAGILFALSCEQPNQQTGSIGQIKDLDTANHSAETDLAPSANSWPDVPANLAYSPNENFDAALVGNNFGTGLPTDEQIATMPYYCHPSYPANVRYSIAACNPYRSLPFYNHANGFGLGVGPDFGSAFPPGPIDYRIKDHVGRVDNDDDDDHHHHRHNRKHGKPPHRHSARGWRSFLE